MSGASTIGDNQCEVVAVSILLGQSCGVAGCFSWLLLLLAVELPTSSFLALSRVFINYLLTSNKSLLLNLARIDSDICNQNF